jgi:hypothetical protein
MPATRRIIVMPPVERRASLAIRLGPWAAALLLSGAAGAAPPDATQLRRDMKAALEPSRPSVRRLQMEVSAPGGESTRWTLGEARKRVDGRNRMLIVVLAPADQRGIALLLAELPDQTDAERWLYVPAVRRVRTILRPESYQAFLGSDFTLEDLSFVSLRSHDLLLGREKRGGVAAYKVQEIPTVPGAEWYYTRIVSWIAADTALPLERDFYDPANALWKVERFRDVARIDGVPTIMKLRMDDVQTGSWTTIDVVQLRYGADVADGLFDPEKLPVAASSPLW